MAAQSPLPTWRAFLHSHMHDIVAVDMFVVATATFRLLYALVVLGHYRRKIIHFDVTQNPTQVWLARQITEAFPWDTAPHYLLRDRDASYGQAFCDRVHAMGIKQVVTAARSPWQNAFVERIIGSIRRECLNHLIISTNFTCALYCHRIFIITTRPERISRSTRIVRRPVPYTRPPRARSSHSPRSADCIIATNGAPPELYRGGTDTPMPD